MAPIKKFVMPPTLVPRQAGDVTRERATVIENLCQFFVFSDLVVALGVLLGGIGFLANIRFFMAHESRDMETKLMEISWFAIVLFSCLIMASWNLLSTIILFVGVQTKSLVMLRLWWITEFVTMVFASVVFISNLQVISPTFSSFIVFGFAHKAVIMTAVTMLIFNLRRQPGSRTIFRKIGVATVSKRILTLPTQSPV